MVSLLTTLKIRDKGTYFFSITQIKNEKIARNERFFLYNGIFFLLPCVNSAT